MKTPFEYSDRGHPVLDTEEKLQWYMNCLLHREVDLYFVNAEACNLDTVYLRRRKCLCLQQANMSAILGAAPTFIEPDIYGQVDRSVVEVLRAIHARRDAEMEQRRREAAIEDYKEQQRLMIEAMAVEKEIKANYKSWWDKLFNGKNQSND